MGVVAIKIEPEATDWVEDPRWEWIGGWQRDPWKEWKTGAVELTVGTIVVSAGKARQTGASTEAVVDVAMKQKGTPVKQRLKREEQEIVMMVYSEGRTELTIETACRRYCPGVALVLVLDTCSAEKCLMDHMKKEEEGRRMEVRWTGKRAAIE